MRALGEARYGFELGRLLTSRELRATHRRDGAATPVLLVPGFMAGDASLTVLRSWLRARGHRVAMSGIRMNTDCAEKAANRLHAQVQAFATQSGCPVAIIGQSRGGTLARVVAVRAPDSVSALVMLGSPVVDPLAVSRPVLRALRSVAWLGDAGVPGMLSTACRDGACCAPFQRDLARQLPQGITATAIFSRSDGIVAWRACLDPSAQHVEVDSSHTGMSVNREVYRVLERVLATPEEESAWSG